MPSSKPVVVERLVSRTCGWRGVAMPYSGKGRPPSLQQSAPKPGLGGPQRRHPPGRCARHWYHGGRGPVREVVERTTIVEKPVVVPGPPTAPVSAEDWRSLLDQLAAQLRTGGKVGREHWKHRKLFSSLMDVYTALDRATPGGLDNLTTRRAAHPYNFRPGRNPSASAQ